MIRPALCLAIALTVTAYRFATKGDQPWIAKSYLGIDKGLVLLMFENHSTQPIWRLVHQNAHIQNGLKRLEFVHVK